MKKTTTTTTATADLYAQAERAVYIALKARHEKSGLQFLADLQNSYHTDSTARNATRIAEQIADHESTHDSFRKGVDFFTAQSNRLTLSAEERATAHSIAEDLRTKAQTEQKRIADLYDTLNTTYTDRADLVQTALVRLLEVQQDPAPITATVLEKYGAETAEDLTEDERTEAQQTANFRAVINAVGKAISTLTAPDAMNRHTTKSRKATAQEVKKWMQIVGGTGAEYKRAVQAQRASASVCFDTMEYRNGKERNGWYLIRHYVTIAPYQYIEDYAQTDENGENDVQYIKTYNPFVSSSADLDRLEELAERANLTDRQREFLNAFCCRCRFDGDFKSCKAYAFKAIGISSDRTQRDFFAKLKTALKNA